MIQVSSTSSRIHRMRPVQPKIYCQACYHRALADGQWHELCWQCAQKIRLVDSKSISPAGIWSDMMDAGIPVRGRSKPD